MKSAPLKPGVMKSARSLAPGKSLAFSAVGFSDGRVVIDAGDKIFEETLPTLCYKYNCPFPIMVKKEFRQDNYLKELRASLRMTKTKKSVMMPTGPPSLEDQKSTRMVDAIRSRESISYPNAKLVTAIYDDMSLKLCEISIKRMKSVPRILIQTICLLAVVYDHLTKITISRSQIDVYTVHEMHKYLPETYITEVCLDESPVPEGIFALLLGNGTKLKNLSLSRCKINDAICSEIASKLSFSEEAGKTLQILDLSSNHITNSGAKQLSEALRTNRHLRYLNLANNRIGDEGAIHIFNVLKEFPLTKQEFAAKRYRYATYLKTRMQYYLNYLRSLIEEDAANKQKKAVGKKKYSPVMPSFLKMRAEELAGKALGPFSDPFASQHVVRREGLPHCRGNYVLCYLNLAYNHLSYLSVKCLLTVITYQSLMLNFSDIGLLRVIIEGNNVPERCSELTTISDLINKNISRFSAAPTAAGRRKSRMSRMSLAPGGGDLASVKTTPEASTSTVSQSIKKIN